MSGGQPLDTGTAIGKLMLAVIGAVGQFEREMMLERQREGIAKAKRDGRYKGRAPTLRRQATGITRLKDAGVTGVNPDRTRWKVSEDDAIRGIDTGKWDFYTHVDGRTADVIIAVHLGQKYLKTKADGVHPDNLLTLNECP
jgi:Protein of unknown function (DUF3892)/Resolvase, N terminal domain